MCQQWSNRLLHQFQTDVVNKDCVLIAEDGTRVEGHCILLASVSGMLADALSGHQKENEDEMVTVLVPAAGEVLRQLFTWIYFGALPESRTGEVAKLAKFLRVYGVGDVILHKEEREAEKSLQEILTKLKTVLNSLKQQAEDISIRSSKEHKFHVVSY